MLLDIVLFSFIIAISAKCKIVGNLILLISLLPFHSFIKDILTHFFSCGTLFSFWKEAVIIIVLIKVLSKSSINKRVVSAVAPFVVITVFYFFIGLIADPVYSFIHLRDYLFPFILVVVVSSTVLSENDIRKLLRAFVWCALIVSIFGFCEYLYSPLRIILAIIKDMKADYYQGTIYYNTTWMILGYQRMVSFFDNPNQLGIYLALFILVMESKGRYYLNDYKGIKRLILLSFIGFALLFTFSRTSFALLIVTLILSLYGKEKGNRLSIMFKAIVLFVFIGIMILMNSTAFDVINSTLNGSEASSAERGNNMQGGLDYVLSNPFGSGLGTSDQRSEAMALPAVVESANLNLCVEEGLIGLVLLFVTFFKLGRQMPSKNPFSCSSKILLFTSFFTAFFSVTPYLYFYLYILMLFIGIDCSKTNHYILNK